jgi:hypothetical protein
MEYIYCWLANLINIATCSASTRSYLVYIVLAVVPLS